MSLAALLAVAGGCRQSASDSPAPTTEQPARSVTVVKPERKTIRREVAQPGLIQAFERTPIVARIPGYVLKWNVDIGDPIKKGDILAELWVPEMVSELKLKEEQVQQAQKALAMTKAQVVTARPRSRRPRQASAGLNPPTTTGRARAPASPAWSRTSVLDKANPGRDAQPVPVRCRGFGRGQGKD